MKTYTIECRTGCSCCADENHYRGLYESEALANERVIAFQKMPLLASQYSKTGVYRIEERWTEQLPDGRLIIGDRIFPASQLIREGDVADDYLLREW